MYNYMIFFFEKCFLEILYPWHRQYSPAQCYLHPSYNHTLPFFDNSCRAILFWITDDKFLSLRYKMSIFHRKLRGKGRNFIIFKDTVTSWCRSIFIYPITYIILLWCFNFQLQNMLEKVFSKEENLKMHVNFNFQIPNKLFCSAVIWRVFCICLLNLHRGLKYAKICCSFPTWSHAFGVGENYLELVRISKVYEIFDLILIF